MKSHNYLDKIKITIVITLCLLNFQLSGFAQFKNLTKDSIYSNLLQEKRDLIIYLPTDLVEKKDSGMHYPVLYVLDGSSHYLSLSGMIHELAETSRTYTLPKMIVVFVNNTKRTRDLTPYPIQKSDYVSEEMAKETGGAETFTKSIEEEIFPYIASKYQVTNYRALIGHSFGGIFALNILAKHKHMFDDYIVIDPSTWYDNRKFANGVIDSLSKNDYKGKTLFLTIANTTNQTDTNRVKNSTATFSEHEKSILAFNKKVKAIKNNLVYTSKYYPNDNHSSVPIISIYDGIRFLFKDIRFNIDEIIEPGYNPKKDISAYFNKVSKKIQYNIKPSSSFLEICDSRYGSRKDEKNRAALRAFYMELYPQKAAAYLNKLNQK